MPMNAKVFVNFGPYNGCGIVDHRLHRLEGLKKVLEKAGHSTYFVPITDWNIVEIWVNGKKVFSCDIRDLDFGGDGILDALCLEACKTVNEAY